MADLADRLWADADKGMLSRDPAYGFQYELAREWLNHLEQVLRDEDVPADAVERILRGFLYGVTPSAAEAHLRQEMTQAHRSHLMKSSFPPSF